MMGGMIMENSRFFFSFFNFNQQQWGICTDVTTPTPLYSLFIDKYTKVVNNIEPVWECIGQSPITNPLQTFKNISNKFSNIICIFPAWFVELGQPRVWSR